MWFSLLSSTTTTQKLQTAHIRHPSTVTMPATASSALMEPNSDLIRTRQQRN